MPKFPEVQKLLGLLADMGSDEVFMFGDKTCVDFVELFQTVNAAQSYGPILAQITGEAEGRQPNEIQGGAVLSALAHNPKLIAVPNFIMGCKLKSAELAKEELTLLETYGTMLLETNDKTKGHFKKTKIDGHEYLVLNLDGGMVPWDLRPAGEAQGDGGRGGRRPEGRQPAQGVETRGGPRASRQLPAGLDRFVVGLSEASWARASG